MYTGHNLMQRYIQYCNIAYKIYSITLYSNQPHLHVYDTLEIAKR